MAPFSVHTHEHYGVVSLPSPQSRSICWKINPDGTKQEEIRCSSHVETPQNKGQSRAGWELRVGWEGKASNRPCLGRTGMGYWGDPTESDFRLQPSPLPSGGGSVLKPSCDFPYLILSRRLETDAEMQTRNYFNCKSKNPFL